MDILNELNKKNKELTVAYSLLQIQQQTITSLSEKIKHLEQLLTYQAEFLDFNKD